MLLFLCFCRYNFVGVVDVLVLLICCCCCFSYVVVLDVVSVLSTEVFSCVTAGFRRRISSSKKASISYKKLAAAKAGHQN